VTIYLHVVPSTCRHTGYIFLKKNPGYTWADQDWIAPMIFKKLQIRTEFSGMGSILRIGAGLGLTNFTARHELCCFSDDQYWRKFFVVTVSPSGVVLVVRIKGSTWHWGISSTPEIITIQFAGCLSGRRQDKKFWTGYGYPILLSSGNWILVVSMDRIRIGYPAGTCDFFGSGLDLDIHFWKKLDQDIGLISVTKFSWEWFKMSQMMVAVFSLLCFYIVSMRCTHHNQW